MNAYYTPPLSIGNSLFVDAVNGNDATGARGTSKPFLTLAAAKAAATSGDTVIVGPGAYTVTASLAKTGVNWHFMVGANVTGSAASSAGIWDDGGSAMTFSVTGDGDFTRTATGFGNTPSLIKCSHASSVISVEGRDFTATSSDDSIYGANQSAGQLFFKFRKCVTGGSADAFAILWTNGRLDVDGSYLYGEGTGVWWNVEAAPTGDAYIHIDEIVSPQFGLYSLGALGNATAAIWIEALVIRGGAFGSVWIGGLNKAYVTAQKLIGQIHLAGAGLVYVTSDKVTAIANGAADEPSLLYANGSTIDARINVNHWDSGAFTGEQMKIVDGIVQIGYGDHVAPASAKGFEITGGTARLTNLRINTAANSSSNPITKSGGTLILNDCTLVAEATRDSISAPTAQNVLVYSAVANRPVDGDVTEQVGLTVVNSNVQ